MSHNEALKNAQRAVAKILCDLENETGQVVERLDLHDIDVTTMGDETSQLLRSVRIELKRKPGTQWSL